MKITTGPFVEGDRFFGRERELKTLEGIFENKKASVLIPGPRRFGKTSIVKEFMRRNSDKYKFVYFDLESRSSFVALCKDLIKEIEKKHPELIKKNRNLKSIWNKFSEMIPKVGVAGLFDINTGKIHSDANELMSRLEDVMEILNENGFIFAFDEFSDFLWKLNGCNIMEVKHFLSWLRRLRQEEKVRLIISGSINIISTAEELNVSDLINDLTDLNIMSLTNDEIKALLIELTKYLNITFTSEGLEFAVKKLSDGIPFFTQLFASGLSLYNDSGGTEYDVESIKNIYSKVISKQHKEFNDLHARLKDYLPKNELKVCYKILAHLASDSMTFDDLWPYTQEEARDKETLIKLLKRLSDECYITKDERIYRFVSPMLADWWGNNYDWEK